MAISAETPIRGDIPGTPFGAAKMVLVDDLAQFARTAEREGPILVMAPASRCLRKESSPGRIGDRRAGTASIHCVRLPFLGRPSLSMV